MYFRCVLSNKIKIVKLIHGHFVFKNCSYMKKIDENWEDEVGKGEQFKMLHFKSRENNFSALKLLLNNI